MLRLSFFFLTLVLPVSTTAIVTQLAPATSSTPGSTPSSTGSITSAAIPTSSNVATANDPSLNDQLTTNRVAWWFYTGQTEEQVTLLWNQNNARITQIRVDN